MVQLPSWIAFNILKISRCMEGAMRSGLVASLLILLVNITFTAAEGKEAQSHQQSTTSETARTPSNAGQLICYTNKVEPLKDENTILNHRVELQTLLSTNCDLTKPFSVSYAPAPGKDAIQIACCIQRF
jgi:hypothetical protein